MYCTMQGIQGIFCNNCNWSVTLKIFLQIVLRNREKRPYEDIATVRDTEKIPR